MVEQELQCAVITILLILLLHLDESVCYLFKRALSEHWECILLIREANDCVAMQLLS